MKEVLCYFRGDVPSTRLTISGTFRFGNTQLQGLLDVITVSVLQ
jgi:hypothetical protein